MVLAIRNDLERVLTAPITANASIAENSLVQDWLAAGEDAPRILACALDDQSRGVEFCT